MEEVRKKWDVFKQEAIPRCEAVYGSKTQIQHWLKKMKFHEKEIKFGDKELAKMKGQMVADVMKF